jgi:diguanylate cyclase (GGDEF)-like protein/PAS domain S-box-containing protein
VSSASPLQGQLRTCQQMFEASFHAAAIGKAIVAVTGRCVEVNAAFANMLGFPQASMAGKHFADFTHPLDIEADLDLFESVMRGERDTYQLEKRYLRNDGTVLDVLLSATCVRDQEGVPIQFISEIVDLTELSRARRELQEANACLRQLVVTDHLTGLGNRRGFEEALSEPVKGRGLGLLMIDLDNFKEVNDRLGHCAGDLVLAEVGRRLPQEVRQGDIVARVGGDEFGVILRDADCRIAARIADRVVSKLNIAYDIKGEATHIGASVGVSCSDGSSSPRELLSAADGALYAAKRAGRGRWALAA